MTADLDAIRARADAATPGPWTFTDDVFAGLHVTRVATGVALPHGGRLAALPPDELEDAEFIANARTDIPALCDEIEAKDRIIQAVLDLHSHYDNWLHCTACGEPLPCPIVRLIEGTGP